MQIEKIFNLFLSSEYNILCRAIQCAGSVSAETSVFIAARSRVNLMCEERWTRGLRELVRHPEESHLKLPSRRRCSHDPHTAVPTDCIVSSDQARNCLLLITQMQD